MKSNIALFAVIILVAVVGIYGYTTYNPSQTSIDEPITKLVDNSENIEEITTIEQFVEIKNKTPVTDTSSDILSKEVIKKEYEEKLPEISGFDNVTVNVNGPYKYDNGTLYYLLELPSEDDYLNLLEVDAKTKPTVIDSQDCYISQIYNQFYLAFSDKEVAISKEEVLNKVKSIESHYNDNYQNSLYKVILYQFDGKNYYEVNVDYGDWDYVFDADTGELLYDINFAYENIDESYKVECKQIAQSELDSKNYDYQQYLSLGECYVDWGRDIHTYTFDIVYTNGDDTQIIGNITVDAKNRRVLEFNINDPVLNEVINETITDDSGDENTTGDDSTE